MCIYIYIEREREIRIDIRVCVCVRVYGYDYVQGISRFTFWIMCYHMLPLSLQADFFRTDTKVLSSWHLVNGFGCTAAGPDHGMNGSNVANPCPMSELWGEGPCTIPKYTPIWLIFEKKWGCWLFYSIHIDIGCLGVHVVSPSRPTERSTWVR